MSESTLPSDRRSIAVQLLRQQDRAFQRLQQAQGEIDTPVTRSLLERLRTTTGEEVEAGVGEAIARLARAVQAVQYCQSELRREIITARGESPSRPSGGELPASMARFLTERGSAPGFSYEAEQDPVRGWVLHWKQHTAEGTVRGAGKLCERPYAWLDE